MGRKKISDTDLLKLIDRLKEAKRVEWENRFGYDITAFTGLQRSEIQQGLKQFKNIEYSAGGMRGRLKALVKNRKLEKFRIGGNTVYYL